MMKRREPCLFRCLRLLYEERESVEPHGERFLDGRWVCPVCGTAWTEEEIVQIATENARKR
jgi:hypothetical protein